MGQSRRRQFLIAAGALLVHGTLSGMVMAQSTIPRLAWIGSGTPEGSGAYVATFRERLRENGLAEGKDYVLEPFWSGGKYERFPALVQEALARKPAIILVATIASVRAAQQATKTIPIVFVGTNDPVGNGLVASFARPGGNTTGAATMMDDRAAKLVELTREALPKAKRIAVLINPLNPSNHPISRSIQSAAISKGMVAEAFEVDAPERIGDAITALSKTRPDALITGFDALLVDQNAQIVSLSIARRIPVITPYYGSAGTGALLGFGPSPREFLGPVAVYVKKILAGAKPADLPVEQPTKFEIAVNMKTAKALGIAIPKSFLARADLVIE